MEVSMFELDYLVLPRAVVTALFQGKINMLELRIYAIIQNLSRGESGCFVGNDRMAEWCGVDDGKTISKAITRLKRMGFVIQTRFDGRKRFMRAVGADPKDGADYAKSATSEVAKSATHISNTVKQGGATHTPMDKKTFGLVKDHPINAFDGTMAYLLEKAVRTLPPRTTGIASARTKAWPEQFRILRKSQNEDAIRRTMSWYTTNIGKRFVPLAFSGESFRKKFVAIQRAANRDVSNVADVGKAAKVVAERLNALNWPNGSAASIPSCVQHTMDAYAKLCAAIRAAAATIGTARLRKFAEHVTASLVPAATFAEQWWRAVHARVVAWQGWDGGFGMFAFSAKGFEPHGRELATKYCGDSTLWDRLAQEIKESE